MRARAVRMIVSVVAVVCVVMGVPGAFFASVAIWTSEQNSLEVSAQGGGGEDRQGICGSARLRTGRGR